MSGTIVKSNSGDFARKNQSTQDSCPNLELGKKNDRVVLKNSGEQHNDAIRQLNEYLEQDDTKSIKGLLKDGCDFFYKETLGNSDIESTENLYKFIAKNIASSDNIKEFPDLYSSFIMCLDWLDNQGIDTQEIWDEHYALDSADLLT